MQTRRRYLAVLVPLLLSVSAPAAAQQDRAAMQLSSADNGRAVQMAPGQTVSIKLPAQPGTGYSWTVVQSQALTLIQNEFTGESVPGGRQLQVLTFRADAPGANSLVLAYRRPWERGADAGRFAVTLNVRAR